MFGNLGKNLQYRNVWYIMFDMEYTFMFVGGPKDGQSIELNYIPVEITVGDHVYVMLNNTLAYNGQRS